MSRQLEPYQGNPFIEIGRIISETSYERERRQVRLDNMIIDLIKSDKQDLVIGEVKKSSRFERAAKMQLAYYLFRLKRLGVEAKGQLLFPKEKKKLEVVLTYELENELRNAEEEIARIILMPKPPEALKNRYCKSCGYQEFCYA